MNKETIFSIIGTFLIVLGLLGSYVSIKACALGECYNFWIYVFIIFFSLGLLFIFLGSTYSLKEKDLEEESKIVSQ